MTDEEKEAIEQLRSWREYIIKHKEDVNKANDIEFYLRTVINLIEKQQKEIEERIRNKFISKKESEQKEKQAYIDGTNAADKLCNKKWECKIKAKTEEYLEYDKKYKRYLKDGRECFTMEYYYAKMLQSLLEKE